MPRLRLRQRLMLSVTLLLAGILAAAMALVVYDAHRAVTHEMDSSVKLASELIDASIHIGDARALSARDVADIGHIRHVCLALVDADHPPSPCPPPVGETHAPAWFAAITRPAHIPEQQIALGAGRAIRVLAEPEDEIAETWGETRGQLALLLVFYAAILTAAYLLLGRATVPIARIDHGLVAVEHGDYAFRLPRFSLPEFDGIAARFNHMAATLAAARAENHRLRERSLRIQEDERGKLARELHDELGQSLTAIRADAAGILAKRAQLPATVGVSAAAIADVAGRIYDQTRVMMRRLRPPGLDELGLAAALEAHIAVRRRSHPDIGFALDCAVGDDAFDPDLSIHVFRLVQEALTNALRHAGCGRIAVTLRRRANRLWLHVIDDGRGFNVAAQPRGLGLAGMAERMDLLGGRLRLSSRPGCGTGIHAAVARA